MSKYYFTTEISYLLNPPLPSKFTQIHKANLENVYNSQIKAPLGCSPIPNIPKEYHLKRFGVKTSKDLSASDLIYPSKCRDHLSMYSQQFSPENKSDDSAPASLMCSKSHSTGDQMKEILGPNSSANSTIILPSCAKQLNHDQSQLLSNHTAEKSERQSSIWRHRNALKDKNSVEILWNLLKMKNHEHFKDLKSAFKAYQGESGKITSSDLQRMCQKLGISAPLCVIEKLIQMCDVIDNDGSLSYEEFMHSLNWKGLLLEDSMCKSSPYSTDWHEGTNNPPLDVINHYKTSYSSFGDLKYLVNKGLPSKITNEQRIKTLKQNENSEDLASVLQPSLFSNHGVFKEDLTRLHSKEEIYDILIQSGIVFKSNAFEKAWLKVNKNGTASIGNLWNELKSLCLLHSS